MKKEKKETEPENCSCGPTFMILLHFLAISCLSYPALARKLVLLQLWHIQNHLGRSCPLIALVVVEFDGVQWR